MIGIAPGCGSARRCDAERYCDAGRSSWVEGSYGGGLASSCSALVNNCVYGENNYDGAANAPVLGANDVSVAIGDHLRGIEAGSGDGIEEDCVDGAEGDGEESVCVGMGVASRRTTRSES